jgi:hypothetical protein
MKPVQIISAICMLSAWGIASCSSLPNDIEVMLARDVTDSMLVQPNIADFFSITGVDSTTLQSVKVTCTTISNYEYNTVYTTALPGRSLLLSNPWERANQVKEFEAKVAANIDSINACKIVRPLSSIYNPLVNGLNRLAASSAKKKLYCLYSDLAENMPSFSTYRNTDFTLLKNHRDQVERILENEAKPNNLKGISIYFVFMPRNPRENEIFILMSNLLKQIFAAAGANVFIGANITSNK